LFRFKSFVQTSAAWTSRKQSVRSIFKLERADHATQTVAQSAALASATIPLPNYPEEENCRKKNQQIDRDQRGKADPDHGATLSVVRESATISFPQSKVAVPQTKSFWASDFEFPMAENRKSARYFLACSSSAASLEDLSRKQ
jgi:hypothetical protein